MNDVNVNPAISIDPTALAKLLSGIFQVVDTLAKNQGWTLISTGIEALNGLVSDPNVITLILKLLGNAQTVSQQQLEKIVNLVVAAAK